MLFKKNFDQSLVGKLDDLFAALADFHFHFVVEGVVECISTESKFLVTINEVGIYVRDSYDFNGYQPLGQWNCKRQDAGKLLNGLDWHYVDNSDFREWRLKHGNGKGGDYLVFSDIKTIKTNDSFEY